MIQFANPAALWFLTLIVPVVLLYLLKKRRQDRVVPSILLWQQVLEDTKAHTPFQKLRSHLLLLLQILIIVLFTALLAQPFFPQTSAQTTRWILVLDLSASMTAKEEGGTRLDVAREKLLGVLKSVAPVDTVMLVGVTSEASVLEHFTLNHERIRSRTGDLEPEHVAARWDQVEQLLRPLLKEKPQPRVVIASDFANFPDSLFEKIPFDPIQSGKAMDNLALIRASIDSLPDHMTGQLLFFQIKNFSASTKLAEVEIFRNDELMDAYEIEMAPSGTAEKTIRTSVVEASFYRIRLKPDDKFMLDNEIVLRARPRTPVQVKLSTRNVFLERALNVLPNVRSVQNATIRIDHTIQEAPGIFFLVGDHTGDSTVIQWNASAAPIRFVDPGLWRFSRTRILEAPPGAETLLETSKGTIGYTLERSNRRQVVLGFSLEDSNLPLLAGFPIFISNTIDWIDQGLHPAPQTVTGGVYPKEGPIESGKGFVNFLDANESNLDPGPIKSNSESGMQASVIRQDFSRWFLLTLVSVIILEWWVFHRKG